jgi:hypothetical protein
MLFEKEARRESPNEETGDRLDQVPRIHGFFIAAVFI